MCVSDHVSENTQPYSHAGENNEIVNGEDSNKRILRLCAHKTLKLFLWII